MDHIIEIDLNGTRDTVTLNGTVIDGVRAVAMATDPTDPTGPLLVTLTLPARVVPATREVTPATLSPTPVASPHPRTISAAPTVKVPDPVPFGQIRRASRCDDCDRPLLGDSTALLEVAHARYGRWLCDPCRATISSAPTPTGTEQ